MSLAKVIYRTRERFYQVTTKRVRARKNYSESEPEGLPTECCVCGATNKPFSWTQFECQSCYCEALLMVRQLHEPEAYRIVAEVHDKLNVRNADYSEFFGAIFCFGCGGRMQYAAGGMLSCDSTSAILPPTTSEWLKKIISQKGIITPICNPKDEYKNCCPNCRATMTVLEQGGKKHLKCPRCRLYIKPYYARRFFELADQHKNIRMSFPTEYGRAL